MIYVNYRCLRTTKSVYLNPQIADQKSAIDKLVQKCDDLSQYTRKPNLILDGLVEKANEDIYGEVQSFFKTQLDLRENIQISIAHRLGQGNKTPRPVIIQFALIRDRDLVWSRRFNLKKQGQTKPSYILREHFIPEIQSARNELMPYLKQARKTAEVKRCGLVKDTLVINGTKYGVAQVSELPYGIGDKHHTQNIEDCTFFFTKHSPLSNFHAATFTVNDVRYENVEQFYQVAQAEYFNEMEIAHKMMRIQDPKEIKSLSHKVRKTPLKEKEWYRTRAKSTMTDGVRAKFTQNCHLAEFLTQNTRRYIAECNPRDTFFSTGLSLYNPNKIERSTWPGDNELGNILCVIRDELKK